MSQLAELRALIARHARNARLGSLMPGLSMSADASRTEPLARIYEPIFGIVAQGEKRTMLADRIFDYRPGNYLVVAVDLPVTCQVTQASARAPFLGVGLTLKPELIASVMLESESAGPTLRPQPILVSEASDDLLEPVVRLVRLLDRPHDIPVLRPMIEREIVWRLLSDEQAGTVRKLGTADSTLSRISRATRWIREHFAEPFRVEDLARHVAMSPTSFHRHFRAATAMSPLQYLKRIRLHEARTRLLTKGQDVATVGFSVGYESPSQFSREYARAFGAPPGRDAARLRGALVQNPRGI